MSDEERGDDLFGDSDNEGSTRVPSRQPSPVASSSRSPPPPAAQDEKPVKDEDEDEGGDLFGDDDEDEERTKRGRTSTGTPASPRRSGSRSRSRSGSANPLEYEEEDVAGEGREEERWATLPIPQWNKMKATDDKVWHMKLPAYVNLESKPYDPDLYRETLNEEPIDGQANAVAAKSKMIGVRNTIRWKWVTGGDGKPTRQSNARMLRWSDGSVSLQLGSDLFDVAPSHGASLSRPQDPKPIPSKGLEEKVINTVSSTTFLAVIAKTEQVLVTERAIAGQLSLLPTSMDSKTHLELVKHVGQQHVKHSRMKMLEETAGDEESLQKLLLKSAPNREFIKTDKDKTAGRRVGPRAGGSRGSGLGRTTSSNSLGKKSRARKSYYSDSEEEGSEDGDDAPRRGRERSIGGGAGGDYDEDDGFVVADSDEDDYGSSKKSKNKNKKRKSKRYSDDEDEDDVEDEDDLDEMEQAERRIEARERERKRAKTDGSGGKKRKSRDYVDTDEDEDDGEGGEQDAEGEEEEMEMDIESEED
ncbi:hypothetical protein I302_103999 [Kwoniella bestiolae CBS 10118]|uniref:RNA polymerase-associated protein LEO1 n=1 Tax=Kwoniella bestiolae CBS 10118 TaxID=1296100 RepID=A0A1B9G9Z6_9TREE|nr:RNA polymerase-associated protein LEO1 [Kwoniella bestiolae CBS 10118]OCF27854.1 RNA polymerase-associated protein LEO1 [Kwoniella bestiolae CBS 10118]